MRSQAQIKQTLIDLLPPGAEDLYALGNQDGIGGTLNALAGALKETLSDRIDQLRAEVNPSTLLELLPEWEQALALSNTPIALYGTPTQRRNAVLARLRMSGSFSLDDIRAIIQPYFLYADPTQIEIIEASRSALETAHTYAATGLPFTTVMGLGTNRFITVPDDGKVSPADAILNLTVTTTDLRGLSVAMVSPTGTPTFWAQANILTYSMSATNFPIRLHSFWDRGVPIRGTWRIVIASTVPATVSALSIFVEGVGNLFAGSPPVKVGEGLGAAIFNFAVVADPTLLGAGFDLEGARRALSIWKPGHVSGFLAIRSTVTGAICAIPDTDNAIPDTAIPC